MPAEKPLLKFVSREPRKRTQSADIDHVTLTWRPRVRPDPAESRMDHITREQLMEPVQWIRWAMAKVRC